MNLRQPVAAGSFYEGTALSCRRHVQKLLDAATVSDDLPAHRFGGISPHAGWDYSGPLAAATFKAVLGTGEISAVVLLGADHTGSAAQGEVFDSGVWRTPLGDVPIHAELAGALLAGGPCLRANPQAHAREHSLEVLVPFLQVLQPKAAIVPVAVPPTPLAVEIGQIIGQVLREQFPGVAVVGSTDLTHHGGGRFPAPGGRGEQGAAWSEANDRRMLDLVEKLATAEIIPEAARHENACGAGAIAATVAACQCLGATRGVCLGYTNSYRVIHDKYLYIPDDTTVGYAAMVFV